MIESRSLAGSRDPQPSDSRSSTTASIPNLLSSVGEFENQRFRPMIRKLFGSTVGTLLLCLSVAAQLEDHWVLFEAKEPVTGQVDYKVRVAPKNLRISKAREFLLIVAPGQAVFTPGLSNNRHIVLIGVPNEPERGMTVQWQVDEWPMVKEEWKKTDNSCFTDNNDLLLKRMLAGRRLKVSFARGGETTSVIEYDISGLAQYLPRLGIVIH